MTKPTILVIDDDPVSASVLLSVLADDYQVITVNTGLKTAELARDLQPNCIFLDVMIPDKNGYQVIKELKADPDLCHIPVIMMSSLTKHSDEDLALRLGAQDYLFKPLTLVAIDQKLKKHFG